MNTAEQAPQTLLEAVVYFSDEKRAWKAFVNRRWPDGVVKCPRCECERVHLIETRMVWRCNGCKRQFSVKVGTIFEDSPLPLSKWLPAMWLIANAKNGISSCELARALKVQQRSAWFMLHRIRLTMKDMTNEKLSGVVEADETFVGGKAKNMHHAKRTKFGPEGMDGGHGKAIVVGMLQRGGKVKAQVAKNRKRTTFQKAVRTNVVFGSTVYTDELASYNDLRFGYMHAVIDHTQSYVEGQIHTNCMENFWSLLKRTINGSYVSVEPFHLDSYLDEQIYRFNERKGSDSDRFTKVLGQAKGRRVTYNELTGKEQSGLMA